MVMERHLQCVACHVPQHVDTKKDKPTRAKDVLDIRIVPGNPNTWVECYENTYNEDAVVGKAEQKAQFESQKLQEHLARKEEKLKSFQEEVKKRVTYLQKLKRQEEEQKTLKMVEDEHNLVLQRTLGIRLPYSGNPEDLQTLNKELLKSCIIPCNNDRQLLHNEAEMSDKKVDEIAKEIKSENCRARSKLLQKKLDKYDTSLPGGIWKSPKSQSKKSEKCETDNLASSGCSSVSSNDKSLLDELGEDAWVGKDEIRSTFQREKEDSKDLAEKNPIVSSSENYQIQDIDQYCDSLEPELVTRLNYIYRDFGKDAELEKVQKQNQFWKYRKIFMDIERDQVKEKKKLEDHRKRVQHLKLVKEQERKSAEKNVTQFPEKALVNKTTEDNCPVMENDKDKVKGSKELIQEREMYRYMEALRKVAKERTKVCNISIPPLCSCAATFWDSHPDKCANNCIFYKNIKVYVSALTSALANTR